MRRIGTGAIAISLLQCAQASAQAPRVFLCEVVGSYTPNKAGTLQGIAESPMRGGQTKGQRFQVDIQSGAMTGDGFSSRTWPRTIVLDNGSSDRGSSYKVFYTSPPGGEFINLAYLQINIYEDGLDKPFVLIEAAEVFTGNCRRAS